MLNVVLARHAETIWNEQLRYIGRTDLDLSPLGRANAEAFAAHLKDYRFDAIYASGMKRALQTAGPVAENSNLLVASEPLLNEIDFGLWEGLTHDEIAAAYPGLVDQWLGDPFTVEIPGGEPWPAFADRVVRGWAGITQTVSAGGPRHILVVTHAGCIKVILGRILGLDSNSWWQIHQDKGALNHIAISGGKARIIRINDTDYRCPPGERPLSAPYTIRRCEATDAERIRLIINQSAAAYDTIMEPGFKDGDYMPLEQLLAEMDKMVFYAVDNGGLPVGVMAYQPLKDRALLRHAYVLPACQRLGLGGRLLAHIEAQAVADGYKELLVGTYAENSWAIAFYQKHGFAAAADPRDLLDRYWDIPQCQAAASVVLAKSL